MDWIPIDIVTPLPSGMRCAWRFSTPGTPSASGGGKTGTRL